jgi:serine protease AprX
MDKRRQSQAGWSAGGGAKIQIKKLAGMLVALALFLSFLSTPEEGNSTKASYILQGKNVPELVQLVQSYGGEVTSRFDVIGGVAAVLPVESIEELRLSEVVTAIVPNAPVRLAGKGGKVNIPETDYPDLIGADVAWDGGVTGKGVTVAVVDTGIGAHPGLVNPIRGQKGNRLIGWADFVERSRKPVDPNGHGTHVAGIVANSEKGADGEWNGVAPGVRLVGVRVLNADGFGTYEQVINGIQWVIDHKEKYGIKVMNLSLVAAVQSPYWADPLNQAVMQAWEEGITVVVAAGNTGPGAMSIGVPGNNPYVITVGAFTDNFTPENWGDDYITPFSAAGPTLDGFVKPDVVAPGAHIISTMLSKSKLAKAHPENQYPGQYLWMAGTSQAAAVVSGLSALVLSRMPELNPDGVKFRVMETAFPWVNLETTEALYSMWQQGAGRVNAPDAVYAAEPGFANSGLDIQADIAGSQHYEGFAYYDEQSGEFRLHGDFSDWAGGYGAWAGGYGAWAGGYGAWAGGYGAWAGGYGAWAGGYGAWAGGYEAWAGGYGAWAGGNSAWAGGYGAWAGGYGAWAGGYGAWAGSYGDPAFAERFFTWRDEFGSWSNGIPWGGNWTDYDG